MKGKCLKSDYCLHAHGKEELGSMPPPWVLRAWAQNRKTKLCKNGQGCHFRNCQFAHEKQELGSPKPRNVKTALCKSDVCHDPYCQYAHGNEELNTLKPDKVRLVFCETWKQNQTCDVQNCPCAHGWEQMDMPVALSQSNTPPQADKQHSSSNCSRSK